MELYNNGLCEDCHLLSFGQWRTMWHDQSFQGYQTERPCVPFSVFALYRRADGLIKHAEMNGDIQGFSLCRRGPKLTRLLFANDCLLFCRAVMQKCDKVLHILETYEGELGQKVNRSKITLFFSKATVDGIKTNIKLALEVPEIMQYEKYLGLHLWLGRVRKQASII